MTILKYLAGMAEGTPKVLFEASLSDVVNEDRGLTGKQAAAVFTFFRDCTLFRWRDANNDCEDRANAICMLLDYWGIPNSKGWVFSGAFLKKEHGSLVNCWNYHVAAAVPVTVENEVRYYIIDPATLSGLETIETWAVGITDVAPCYYLIRDGDYYIFPDNKIGKDDWHKRNKQNYKWTIQGLAGINGVSRTGKAQLVFNKTRIKNTGERFKELRNNKPEIIQAAFSV
jgi:hypothetical protein